MADPDYRLHDSRSTLVSSHFFPHLPTAVPFSSFLRCFARLKVHASHTYLPRKLEKIATTSRVKFIKTIGNSVESREEESIEDRPSRRVIPGFCRTIDRIGIGRREGGAWKAGRGEVAWRLVAAFCKTMRRISTVINNKRDELT